ncbi:hemerythrin-like domain-containing protein [Methylohalomonas lacus]|uniref:Hemerythrin-like domain-containing protein n=1 Tax=Methylohalomonas lacus TaxID=398773 RepID=A0AAE3L427_9GAMM|nr:hemerythrin domain-containing protein [Methylohalomonas lacus]MCS3903218.1 hemerythrin-like domain-containing protein [Methylohalomonas lacus]
MPHSALERLQQDHRQIETLLNVLEHQIAAVDRGDRPDYALMYQVMHYLTYYPDRYHHVFEDLLFERLVSRRTDLKPVIDTLAGQHETMTNQGVQLRSLLESVLNDLPVARPDLVRQGDAYLTAYRQHLECEETDVFPALIDSLMQSDWMTLLTRFEWRADPLFAAQADREYDLLVETLQAMGADPTLLQEQYESTCPACSGDGRRLMPRGGVTD